MSRAEALTLRVGDVVTWRCLPTRRGLVVQCAADWVRIRWLAEEDPPARWSRTSLEPVAVWRAS